MVMLRRWLRRPPSLLDARVFDEWFYRSENPDLAMTGSRAYRKHWITNGIDEGRRASPHFSAVEYLEMYPDLAAAFGPNGYRQATLHYLRTGEQEGRRATCPDHVTRLSGEEITMKTSRNWGNAIWSLRWQNKEFINSHDVGRGLTVAWQEDELLEGRNPTEAGNILDSVRSRCDGRSASLPLYTGLEHDKSLLTRTQPAYWLPPGYPGSCVEQSRSSSTIEKRITLDCYNNPHIIKWQVRIDFRDQHSAGRNQIQMLTLFSPGEFSRFFAYNAELERSKRLTPLAVQPGDIWDPCGSIIHSLEGNFRDAIVDKTRSEEILPILTPRRGGVIVATERGSHAIGLYGNSRRDGAGHRGWYMEGPAEMAWACRSLIHLGKRGKTFQADDNGASFLCSVSRFPVREGDQHRFEAYVVVGTVSDVVQAMQYLNRHT